MCGTSIKFRLIRDQLKVPRKDFNDGLANMRNASFQRSQAWMMVSVRLRGDLCHLFYQQLWLHCVDGECALLALWL